MPTVWFSLKKSLHCKSEPSDVVDPKARVPPHHLSSIYTKKAPRSGCSRSIANLKDVVIHGSKRHTLDRPPANCSPRSIGSSEFHNPITHEVILSGNSKCELKITGFGSEVTEGEVGGADESTFVGILKPGTPGPGGQLGGSFRLASSNYTTINHYHNQHHLRRSPLFGGSSLSSAIFQGQHGGSTTTVGRRSSREEGVISCHRCGELFLKWEALEDHHLSKHAVTELVEGDSSRKIVEIICRTSWSKSENNRARIERVFKVHNTQKTLAWFEEYRENVKIRASRLHKKHPRCLADGNELLRFYGTTVTCSLGLNGSSSLCVSEKCSVCRIIRHGFSTEKGGVGVFTASTSGRALEMVEVSEENPTRRKALMVCRVIAGRVHKPLENFQELAGQSGFDSLAGKVGLYANIEELYLLNPRALLPCFVVICKH